MVEPAVQPWIFQGSQRFRGGAEKRALLVRTDLVSGTLQISWKFAEVGEPSVSADQKSALFQEGFRAEDAAYDGCSRFLVHIDDSQVLIGADGAQWSRLEEAAVRKWFEVNTKCFASRRLQLKGRFRELALNGLWPPAVSRGKLEQKGGERKGHYAYLLHVQENARSGRPFVIVLTERRLPEDEGERATVWETQFRDAEPKTTAERRKLGRTMFLESEVIHRVDEAQPTIIVGPVDEEKEVWTPHTRWIVQRWFDSVFQSLGWSLQLTGKVFEKR